MPTKYTAVRRRHRAIDTQRDLHALWRAERFASEAAVDDALRVYEMAIRVEGWPKVVAWAEAALQQGGILNAQLVELAMRALEQSDDDFFQRITEHLKQTAPASYFQFWYALFCARHSHRGERLFREQLARISDYQLVKYRRWVKRIFRKLRFRCKTDRERAIGAIAFAMYAKYDPKSYPSQVFETYLAAHRAAHTPPMTKQAKPVAKQRQAQVFAEAASPLRMWSIAEGIRTSAQIPRTLAYLQKMAPSMSDIELLRSLKAFDAQLATADHKKASELVTSTADYISSRLEELELPLEEWAKILPYVQSPVLRRVLESILGQHLDGSIERLRQLPYQALVVVPQVLDARAFRSGFLLGYCLHRCHPTSVEYLLGADNSLRAVSWPSSLWPYGVGVTPPSVRFEPEPDHPHRMGFELVRELFPKVARQSEAGQHGVEHMLLALRAHLYDRALVYRETSSTEVPLLLLAHPPAEQERAALSALLQHFAAAILVLYEVPWQEPLAGENIVHLSLPRTLQAGINTLEQSVDQVESRRLGFDSRKAAVDQAVRQLLLAPRPPVQAVTRQPRS